MSFIPDDSFNKFSWVNWIFTGAQCFKTPNLPENVATTTLLGLVINCQAPVFSMFGQDYHFYCLHQQPQNVHQESPVLQGSNLEMVDGGVLDRVPDVLET